ncbi:hypothetical protein SUDANB15_07293 [Streptomyces sp. enrichment culture]
MLAALRERERMERGRDPTPSAAIWTARVSGPRSAVGCMATTAARRSAVSNAISWSTPVAPSCSPASARPTSATVMAPQSSSPGPRRTFHACGMCGRTKAIAAPTSMPEPRRPRASPCRSCSVATVASARRGSRQGHDHLRYRSSRWSRDVGGWRGRSPGREGVADCRRTMSTCGATRRASSISPHASPSPPRETSPLTGFSDALLLAISLSPLNSSQHDADTRARRSQMLRIVFKMQPVAWTGRPKTKGGIRQAEASSVIPPGTASYIGATTAEGRRLGPWRRPAARDSDSSDTRLHH